MPQDARALHYSRAEAAFNAWKAMDPKLFSLGVEQSSFLFMAAVRCEKALYLADMGSGMGEDNARQRAAGRLIVQTMLEQLGPEADDTESADILDFTLQDEDGDTAKTLSLWRVDKNGEEKIPFNRIPAGVDASKPFFLQVIPTSAEMTLWRFFPLYLVGATGAYYGDLYLDFVVAMEYYERGTMGGEEAYIRYFYYTGMFYVLGVIITCLFDYITTMDTMKRSNWFKFTGRCVLNILQLRLPWELWKSLRAMKRYRESSTGERIDKTARMPPMSWEQVKCSEGVFEALPQAMFQAFVVINDLYRDKYVSTIQALSLLTSYGNVALVLGTMGPPDISIIWRVSFIVFVVINVALRSVTFAFATILDNQSKYCNAPVDGIQQPCYGASTYYIVSFLITAIFVFRLQRKSRTLASVILTIIGFMCPVEISSFTVLKMARPKPPQLPFSVYRFTEIIILVIMFARLQEHSCVVTTNVPCPTRPRPVAISRRNCNRACYYSARSMSARLTF